MATNVGRLGSLPVRDHKLVFVPGTSGRKGASYHRTWPIPQGKLGRPLADPAGPAPWE